MINLTFKNWFLPFFFIFRDSRIEILGTAESLARAVRMGKTRNQMTQSSRSSGCAVRLAALRCYRIGQKNQKHLQLNFLGIWNRYAPLPTIERVRSFEQSTCWKWRVGKGGGPRSLGLKSRRNFKKKGRNAAKGRRINTSTLCCGKCR